MQTSQQIESNGNRITTSKLQSILEEMKKITSGGNLKVANKHWNIYGSCEPVNNTYYSNMSE